jgi:hypothetical protein
MMSERHFSKYMTRELNFLGYVPSDDAIDLIVDVVSEYIESTDEFSQDELENHIHLSFIEKGYGSFGILLEDIADITMKYLEDNEIMEIEWNVEVDLDLEDKKRKG